LQNEATGVRDGMIWVDVAGEVASVEALLIMARA
jgi:hypothetical protein